MEVEKDSLNCTGLLSDTWDFQAKNGQFMESRELAKKIRNVCCPLLL
jgi:hypothetical protein